MMFDACYLLFTYCPCLSSLQNMEAAIIVIMLMYMFDHRITYFIVQLFQNKMIVW